MEFGEVGEGLSWFSSFFGLRVGVWGELKCLALLAVHVQSLFKTNMGLTIKLSRLFPHHESCQTNAESK